MMKIDPISQYGIQQYQKSINKVDTGVKAEQADKADISKQAMELQSNQADRQAIIDEIKTQIENGTYQVNARATAEGLLNVYSKKQ